MKTSEKKKRFRIYPSFSEKEAELVISLCREKGCTPSGFLRALALQAVRYAENEEARRKYLKRCRYQTEEEIRSLEVDPEILLIFSEYNENISHVFEEGITPHLRKNKKIKLG